MNKIVNLTPHAVNLFTGNGGPTFNPNGQIARVKQTTVNVGVIESEDAFIPLVKSEFGQVEGLPEFQDGTFFIVSTLVRLACPERKDLISPAKLVRDEKGNIIGCEAFEVN